MHTHTYTFDIHDRKLYFYGFEQIWKNNLKGPYLTDYYMSTQTHKPLEQTLSALSAQEKKKSERLPQPQFSLLYTPLGSPEIPPMHKREAGSGWTLIL